jgi:methionine-rich copper-binding protein CopC
MADVLLQPRHRSPLEQRRRGAAPPRWSVALLGVVVGMLLPLVPATGAQAHAVLRSISPADGAQLTQAPTQVVLTFDEPVSTSFATVTVTDASGDSVVSGRTQVDGAKVTRALKGDLPSGKYSVAYRVVSDDGHPVSDKTTFTLALPASDTPTSDAPTSDAPTSSTSPSSTSAATPSRSTSPPTAAPGSAADATDSGSDGGVPVWVWVVVGIVVLAGVGGTAAARERRGRQGS